jgi:hypothetical protein
MNLEQRLRENLVAPDPGAAFTARVMARVTRARTRRGPGFVVVVAVLVAGVAAAMLGWQAIGTRVPAVPVMPPTLNERAVAPDSGESPAQDISGVREKGQGRPATEATAVATDVAGPATIRIVLMPAQHNSQDIAAKPAIDAFHSSLLQALRSQRDVVVEVAGVGTASSEPGNRVAVVSPRYTTLPSGSRLYQSGNGRETWQGMSGTHRGPQQWPVEVTLTLAELATTDGLSMVEQTVESHQFIDGNGMLNGQSCDFSSSNMEVARPASRNGASDLCTSVEAFAQWLIAASRPRPVPPVVDTQQLVSRLSDASTYDRPGAFRELLNRARRDGTMLEAAAVKAIAAYIEGGSTPEQRYSSLLALRGMRQPGLVATLLDIVARDADEKVRLEALSMLIAEYGSEGRIRAALETVAQRDASAFVRMVAQRPLSGDGPWQDYVMKALADRSLSAASRLAPVQHEVQQVYGPGGSKASSWLGSAQVTRQLVDMFQELRTKVYQQGESLPHGIPTGLAERLAELGVPPGSAVVQMIDPDGIISSGPAGGSGAAQRDRALQSVLTLLGITNPSAATDLRISVLSESPGPPAWLAMNCLNALVVQRDDPRIRKVLDEIAAGKSGPDLRDMLERNMTMRPQPDASR